MCVLVPLINICSHVCVSLSSCYSLEVGSCVALEGFLPSSGDSECGALLLSFNLQGEGEGGCDAHTVCRKSECGRLGHDRRVC